MHMCITCGDFLKCRFWSSSLDGILWEESKLAQMAWSGPLTSHKELMSLRTHIMRHSLGHGLAVWGRPVRVSPWKLRLLQHWGYKEWQRGYVMWGYITAPWWLHDGYIVAAAVTVESARREAVLWLPCQPGDSERLCSPHGSLSLLPASCKAHALSTLGLVKSVDSVNSHWHHQQWYRSESWISNKLLGEAVSPGPWILFYDFFNLFLQNLAQMRYLL